MNTKDLKFNEAGLIPCIIQDEQSRDVLMLGFMNQEALEKTLAERRVTFFSRSKQRLWTKGETSGNFLAVKNITSDCDQDTLLISVQPSGPVCHTGTETCFGEKAVDIITEIENTIEERKINPAADSYTSSLFSKGINTIAQKVGEEAVEMIIEAKDNDKEKFLNESADLLFHYLVLLNAKGSSLQEVRQVLEKRRAKKTVKP